jgi:hypothetical protein
MKLRLLSAAAALLAASAVVACATSEKTSIADPTAPGATPADPNDPAAAAESDDVTMQPPHSLGTIILGEQHGSGGTTGSTKSTPIVSATFVPDALVTRKCTETLTNGCEIQKAPKCTKVKGTATGCNANEACTYDTSCSAVCKAFAVCDTACSADEVCQPKTTGSTSGSSGTTGTTVGECVKTATFDAGPLAFSGTTTSITMFPPYQFESTGQGAPFLGGAQLTVQASGSTGAGFDKFDETFTATTFLQTMPSLSKLAKSDVFGTGSLPIGWAPGSDSIVISISGAGGTATCKVEDSLGKFDVPRSVIKAAQLNPSTTTDTGDTGDGSLTISVARQKKDVKKDKHAKGSLDLVSVKPDGWLELITLSSESASFQGCGASQDFCGGDTCVDLQYDSQNCGSCGHACTGGGSCYSGTCSGGSSGTSGSSGTTSSCSTCRQNALSGSCNSQFNTCDGNSSCYPLADCADACTTASCVSSCQSSYPSDVSYYAPLKSCLTTYCSSSCGF